MKTTLSLFAFALTLGTLSPAAQAACDQSENQFFGTVRNVQKVTNQLGEVSCTYQLNVAGTPSGVCPLKDSDAQALVLLDAKCTKKNGDAVSGILVTKTWIE